MGVRSRRVPGDVGFLGVSPTGPGSAGVPSQGRPATRPLRFLTQDQADRLLPEGRPRFGQGQALQVSGQLFSPRTDPGSTCKLESVNYGGLPVCVNRNATLRTTSASAMRYALHNLHNRRINPSRIVALTIGRKPRFRFSLGNFLQNGDPISSLGQRACRLETKAGDLPFFRGAVSRTNGTPLATASWSTL